MIIAKVSNTAAKMVLMMPQAVRIGMSVDLGKIMS
jgi:hypothetical protein